MDGWWIGVDRWMDGCGSFAGWMWMDGRVEERLDGWIDMDGWTDKREDLDGQVDEAQRFRRKKVIFLEILFETATINSEIKCVNGYVGIYVDGYGWIKEYRYGWMDENRRVGKYGWTD